MTGILYDDKGNSYWMKKRAIILKLKEKPKSGKQVRNIGQVNYGILRVTKIGKWMLRQYGVWYINRFMLYKHKEFGFNIVQFKGVFSDGTPVTGWFYPELLLSRRYIDYDDLEPQNRLEVSDLSPSPAAALKKWKEEKEAKLAEDEEKNRQKEAALPDEKPGNKEPVAQGSLF